MRPCIRPCQHLLFRVNIVTRTKAFRPPFYHSCRPALKSRFAPWTQRQYSHWQHQHPPKQHYRTVESSYTPYAFLIILLCGGAYVYDRFTKTDDPESNPAPRTAEAASATSEDEFFANMPIAPGHRGNLTPEQDAKLRELWVLTFKTFGVQDPSQPNGAPAEETPTASDVETADPKKKKSRMSIFRKHEHPSPSSSPKAAIDDSDDKYGQVKEYQQILSTQTPESLRKTFWCMVKADHPDGLLLRFLRARKWDVNKALVMMISTMSWRGNEMHVDDDVIYHGEIGAVRDSKSSDPAVKREADDFLAQMRLGKSFLHGTDKEGRPLCFVRARLHHGGDQTEKSMERYTVYVIETARLILRSPVETATILFDMTHFTMANMDYTPVKFMIKVFEANYPESLGTVLVHKSPWLFQGIWKIIKGWLDPVVAAKVHFTSSVEDLEEYIPRKQIIKELGGDEDWEYKFIEPSETEDSLQQDDGIKSKLEQERKTLVNDYESATFQWIHNHEDAAVRKQRDETASKLNDNYWQLDPYVRARTLYDRVGMIKKGGAIEFYPSHEKAATAPATNQTADDDVD